MSQLGDQEMNSLATAMRDGTQMARFNHDETVQALRFMERIGYVISKEVTGDPEPAKTAAINGPYASPIIAAAPEAPEPEPEKTGFAAIDAAAQGAA